MHSSPCKKSVMKMDGPLSPTKSKLKTAILMLSIEFQENWVTPAAIVSLLCSFNMLWKTQWWNGLKTMLIRLFLSSWLRLGMTFGLETTEAVSIVSLTSLWVPTRRNTGTTTKNSTECMMFLLLSTKSSTSQETQQYLMLDTQLEPLNSWWEPPWDQTISMKT